MNLRAVILLALAVLLGPAAALYVSRWLRRRLGCQVPAPRRRMGFRSWLRIKWRLWRMSRHGPFRPDGEPLDWREKQALHGIRRDLGLPAAADAGYDRGRTP